MAMVLLLLMVIDQGIRGNGGQSGEMGHRGGGHGHGWHGTVHEGGHLAHLTGVVLGHGACQVTGGRCAGG